MSEIDWDTAIRRDGPAAWHAAYRITGNAHDSDECLQEALVAAVGIARAGEVRSFRALLLRLATSRAVDKLRRGRRLAHSNPRDLESVNDFAPTPAAELESRELLEDLRDAIGSLPPQQAQIFILSCIEDWTHEQIARELSMTPGAVGMSLLRARKQLRDSLFRHRPDHKRGDPWTRHR